MLNLFHNFCLLYDFICANICLGHFMPNGVEMLDRRRYALVVRLNAYLCHSSFIHKSWHTLMHVFI